VLNDTIQPFPSFSEIYADALKALRRKIEADALAVHTMSNSALAGASNDVDGGQDLVG